jgi:NAD-dependent dihydropyrimidine dehydrogenase PreA subunit
MAKRKIIEIDREKCNGCGLCTTACAEGALALDGENKAVLVREIYCDGLGACLDVCPTDALKVVERDSEEYDSKAAFTHVLKSRGAAAAAQVHGVRDVCDNQGGNAARVGWADRVDQVAGRGGHRHGHAQAHAGHSGCLGSLAREIAREPEAETAERTGEVPSRLSQWPIQLHLISPNAPYFQGSDLLVAADCTAFALGGFHDSLLKGKKLVIACPKLDETEGYVEKLAELIKRNDLKSLTVAIMTVPCCSGLERIVRLAVEMSGVRLEVKKIVVGLDGRIAARA